MQPQAFKTLPLTTASSWSKGWKLIVHSLKVFQQYPVFVLPIALVWLIYAPTILYLKYFYHWDNYNSAENIATVFVEIAGFSFLIVLSCDLVLEMIRQIENGEPSIVKAIAKVFSRDILKILPLALVWAIIWFVLTVLECLFSKKGANANEDLNAQNAAATLSGYGTFSLSAAFFSALEKGVRMVVFLILPAIAWENLEFKDAVKKGLAVLRAHLGVFGSGYALTYAAAGIIFLPPAIILTLGTSQHGNPPLIHFPDSVWMGVIIYIGFAWSFSMYLEQMFVAQLYLWHLKWEKAMDDARRENKPLPSFSDIGQPLLLAKVPNLFTVD